MVKRSGALVLLGVVAALLVFVMLADRAWAWIEAPWSLGGPNAPTLTGTWEGPLQAQQGAQYRLLLNLEYNRREISRRRSRARSVGPRSTLEGTGRVCTAGGAVHELEVSRGVADRSGRTIQLRVSHVDPSQSGLWVEWQASWRGDRLLLERASHNPFLPSGVFSQNRTTSSADPPDPLAPAELRKAPATTFESACRQLAGRA